MNADRDALTLEGVTGIADEFLALREEWRPGFLLALACAALVHAGFILWVGRAAPRYVGVAGGSSQTINVEIVDEADFRERASPADATNSGAAPKEAPAAEPAAEATPAPQPSAAPESAEAKQPAEVSPAQEWAAVPSPNTELKQPSPSEKVPKRGKGEPQQPKEQSEPKQEKRKPAAKEKVAAPSLDLQVPLGLTLQESASAGSSSATRPAGITRSGENDRFGRDVVRALKKTMPESPGHTGRIKIRIFLDERGNVKNVQLVQSGGDWELDQSVIFSAYQTAFPFPPKGATVADRTFLITYIYR
jgi:TonB family protein